MIAWGLVVFYTDPVQAGFLSFSLFYLSLFLTLSGLILLVGNYIRGRFFKKQLIEQRLKTSLRQAIFFSVLIIGWLVLKSQGLAHWWVIVFFILILTVLEFFFISFQKQKVYEG